MSALGIDQTGAIDSDGDLTIYDFENRDNAWGTTYGVSLVYKWFPTTYQTKGQSVYQTPIGKIVVTCRRIVLLSKRHRKAIEWMQNNIADPFSANLGILNRVRKRGEAGLK